MEQGLLKFLEHKAFNMRASSIISTSQAGSGHPTSSLSAADIVSVLFFHTMKYDPKDSNNPNNDRFILSKGHAAPLLYAAWKEVGVLSDEDLLTLRDIDSVLEGHPTPRFDKVEAATGSLGQGLSIGVGIALSAKLDKRNFYTYVLIGDSESSEGQIWEAAEIAAYYKLNNLIAIIDVNNLGQTGETMYDYNLDVYKEKFTAFGWHAIEVDGHNIKALVEAFDKAKKQKNKPVMIIAKTVKGYGIKSIEGKNGYHGKPFEKDELSDVLEQLHKRFPEAAKYNPKDEKFHWKPDIPKSEEPNKVKKEIKLPEPLYKIGEEKPTRKVYGEALVEVAKLEPQLLSLDAEVKNSTYAEILEKEFPNRFIQCFIAEQNMISMAVGLLSRGKLPFASTFGAFMTRAFDQIRMAAISRSALRLCGSHAGVSIGEDGPSQMALEDIAMFRAIPGSVILYPCDAVSTYKLVGLMANNHDSISYLRTTRMGTPVIYENSKEFKIGGCHVIKKDKNDSACLIGAGITLHEALKAYDQLKKEGISVSVIDLYSIKPLDEEVLLEIARNSGNLVITSEDHYLDGGLGQAVAYALRNKGITVECLAVTKMPKSGTPEELLAYEGIDAKAIIKRVKEYLNSGCC